MARIPLQAYSLEPTGADKPTALPPQHFYLFLCSHQCTFLASPLGLIELLTVQSQTQLTGQEVGPLDTAPSLEDRYWMQLYLEPGLAKAHATGDEALGLQDCASPTWSAWSQSLVHCKQSCGQ